MTSQRRGDLTRLRDVGCGWREGYGRAAWPSGLKNKRTKKLNEKKKKKPSVLLFKSVASSTVSSAPESQETSKNKQVFQILQTTAEARRQKKKKQGGGAKLKEKSRPRHKTIRLRPLVIWRLKEHLLPPPFPPGGATWSAAGTPLPTVIRPDSSYFRR